MTIGQITVEGLADLRRALRQAEAAGPRQLTAGLKRAGVPIVRRTAATVPHRTGALAASYAPSVRGTNADIISRVPYGAGAEWGRYGKWRGWPGSPPRFVWPAMEAEQGEVIRLIDLELRDIVTAFGWFHE